MCAHTERALIMVTCPWGRIRRDRIRQVKPIPRKYKQNTATFTTNFHYFILFNLYHLSQNGVMIKMISLWILRIYSASHIKLLKAWTSSHPKMWVSITFIHLSGFKVGWTFRPCNVITFSYRIDRGYCFNSEYIRFWLINGYWCVLPCILSVSTEIWLLGMFYWLRAG